MRAHTQTPTHIPQYKHTHTYTHTHTNTDREQPYQCPILTTNDKQIGGIRNVLSGAVGNAAAAYNTEHWTQTHTRTHCYRDKNQQTTRTPQTHYNTHTHTHIHPAINPPASL